MTCKRKTFVRVVNFRTRLKPRVRHWLNLRHDDAACGAWGTWRIPAGGIAHRKCDVTCAKCRRLCGLDGGPDLRKVVDAQTRDARQAKQRAARLKRWAKDTAAKVMHDWRRQFVGGPGEQGSLESMIAAELLRAKEGACRAG